MKQLVILSGKGGTGKTSFAAALAHFSSISNSQTKAVMVDADVDAANLGLVLQLEPSDPQEFWGGSQAQINAVQCTGCGNCIPVCRYDAILPDHVDNRVYMIDPFACDGCAACVYACPEGAISMVPQQDGYWFHSKTAYGDLFHAELFPGKENSGKLVTLVKQKARLWMEDNKLDLSIIDGPPGIGCPVISACAGADLGMVVSEPGLSGLIDLERILATLRHFHVPSVICINKADLYQEGTQQIRTYAAEQGIEILGEVPFDDHISQAISQGVPVSVLNSESPASKSIQLIWKKILGMLFPTGDVS